MKNIIYIITVLIGTSVGTITKAQTYTINTLAGNGASGYAGNGGQATAAEIDNATGIAADASGNIYIADLGNNRIRKIDTAGVISTYAGTGNGGFSGDGNAATAAWLNAPTGIAVDGAGNLYIADQDNNRIRKISNSGTISTIAGNGTASYSGDGAAATAAELNNPTGVAVDVSGNIFIADYNNNRVREVNTSGTISTIAGTGSAGYSGDGAAATAAELFNPIGVAVDGSGNVYIADEYNGRIRKVTKSGVISTYYSYTSSNPAGVAVDASGNVYFTDQGNNTVLKGSTTIAGDGVKGYSGDGGSSISAELYSPYGVAVDYWGSTRNIYIADEYNYRIRILITSPTGISPLSKTSPVSLYPNPNKGIFSLRNTMVGQHLNIYNMLGEQIYCCNLIASETLIDLSSQPKGVYLYRVLYKDGEQVTAGKLIVQ